MSCSATKDWLETASSNYNLCPSSVPRQRCSQVPSQQCESVARRVPSQRCFAIPRQECRPVQRQVPQQHCRDVPRQECRSVPRQQCQSVPRQQCRYHKMVMPQSTVNTSTIITFQHSTCCSTRVSSSTSSARVSTVSEHSSPTMLQLQYSAMSDCQHGEVCPRLQTSLLVQEMCRVILRSILLQSRIQSLIKLLQSKLQSIFQCPNILSKH